MSLDFASHKEVKYVNIIHYYQCYLLNVNYLQINHFIIVLQSDMETSIS